MTTREAFLAEARSWIDTPCRPQGRRKGKDGAADCIFMICCCAELDIPGAAALLADSSANNYSANRPRLQLLRRIQKLCRQIPIGAARPGDIVCVLVGGAPQHVLVLDEGGNVIHASDEPGFGNKVVRHIAKPRWRVPPSLAFEIPGLA